MNINIDVRDDGSTAVGAQQVAQAMHADGVRIFGTPYADATVPFVQALEQLSTPEDAYVAVSGLSRTFHDAHTQGHAQAHMHAQRYCCASKCIQPCLQALIQADSKLTCLLSNMCPNASAGLQQVYRDNDRAYSVLEPAGASVPRAANLFRSANARTVTFVSDGNPARVQGCSVAQDELSIERISPSGEGNVTILSPSNLEEEYRATQAFLTFLRKAKPDVVGICAGYESTIRFLNRAREQRVDVGAFITAGILTDPRFKNETSLQQTVICDVGFWYSEPVYATRVPLDDPCTDLSPIGCVDSAMLEEWIISQPGLNVVSTELATVFTSLQVLGQAIVGASSDDVTNVIKILRSNRFSSVLGDTLFGRKTHMSTRVTYVRQAQAAGIKLIAPAQVANGVLVYPRPTWAQAACSSTHACGGHGVCTPDGSCDCAFGWSGSTCTVQYEIPMFLFAGLLAAALLLGSLFALRAARRSKRQLALAQQRAKEREAMEEVSRRVHVRTLSYASHELANPLFAIIAT
ncbi:MAG: hypothetical protein EOO65_01830, partial [Methanosarcinales archaeon]